MRGWPADMGLLGVLFVALVACLALPGPALADHAGPLAGQWHLDGDINDGQQTPDSSGHGLHASTDPSASYGPGRFGNAYVPIDFSSIRVGDNALLRPPQVTALAWVRRASDPGQLKYVIARGAQSCSAASWAIYTGTGGGGLQFYVYDGLNVRTSPKSSAALWNGQWHMVAGTFDGSAVRLYIDGQQIGSGTPTIGTSIKYGLSPSNEFSIGSYPNEGCFDSNFGDVDEARVYRRALSGAEIGRLAAASGPGPPALVPDPPAGGAGGAAPAPPRVAPRFATARSRKLRRAMWLSGGISNVPRGVSIVKYSWDFNGDGRFEADCTGQATAVSRPFRKAGTHQVTLQTTDSLGRIARVRQPVSVGASQVNRSARSLFTCEDPLGSNQPDRKDCTKTFSFGIVEVNGRGDSDQCFKVESRVRDLIRASGRASQRNPRARLQNFVDYNAKIAGPVALNGLPVPVPKNRVTEYDSGKSTIGIGTLPVLVPLPGRNPIRVADVPLEQKITPTKGRFKLPPLKTSGVKISKFGGLKLGGGIEIHLLNRAAEVFVSLRLPDVFSFGFKREAEGRVILRTTNAGGFEFEGLRISQIPQVFLGPLYVTNLFFDYRRTGEIWRGGANFRLAAISPVEIKASPPPPDYGFGLRGGRFDYAGGGASFPIPPRPQLFPGVGLVEIGGAIGIRPARFTGRLAIDVGGLFVIDGSSFIGFANEQQPYDFPEEFAPPGLEFLAGRTLDTISIAAGGKASIRVPVVGDLPLINSYVFYGFPDYAEFGGGFKFGIANRFSVDGNVGGFISIGQRKFNLEGQVRGCADIEVTTFCLPVGAVVSSKGIGFCAVVPVPTPLGPTIPVPAGAGYQWGKSIDIHVFSCDIGPYRETRPGASGAQAGRSFTLAKGLPSAMVRVKGRGAVPTVTLTGPRGERILAGGAEKGALSKDVVVIPQTPESTLLVGLRKPSAGRWTITPRAGSSPIAGVAAANGLAAPRIRARVRGRGRKRVLAYAVRRAEGQRVTFAERGVRTWRLLGTARGSRGRIRFSPAAGRRGRRSIVALVERGGVTVKTLTVARYAAPRTARPARPRRLRVRKRRGGLAISWRRVRGAARYGVMVRLSNRRRVFRVTRRNKLFIRGIDRRARGAVLVGGLRGDGVRGREARQAIPRPRGRRR